MHTTHCTLHTAHYTLHIAHYTLHTTHCTIHTTHYTLHITHCRLHIDMHFELPVRVRLHHHRLSFSLEITFVCQIFNSCYNNFTTAPTPLDQPPRFVISITIPLFECCMWRLCELNLFCGYFCLLLCYETYTCLFVIEVHVYVRIIMCLYIGVH